MTKETDVDARVADSISVSEDLVFTLTNPQISYIFRVDPSTGDLVHVHFGAPSDVPPSTVGAPRIRGWSGQLTRIPREFPDSGRGDFRQPAIKLRHDNHCITQFKYKDHEIVSGKRSLEGLPSSFASTEEARSVIVHLVDEIGRIDAYLSYTIVFALPIIIRSLRIANNSGKPIVVETAASLSVDLPNKQWEMLQLSGEWSRETRMTRRPLYPGLQGFQSNSGYSGHLYNPFLAMVEPTTTETAGEALGFSLVYSGSFQAIVDKPYNDSPRILLGLNPDQLSWSLDQQESFITPEVVLTYSSSGLGSMSRAYHRFFRRHLSRSKWTGKTRPTLLNNWEGTYFDFDQSRLLGIASKAAELGCKMFVLDDGWFGKGKYARRSRETGVGDWFPNPEIFIHGLDELIDRVHKLKPRDGEDAMLFGLWVEPEMVSLESHLYEAHSDWVLHAGQYTRTAQRWQCVLNLGLEEVQEYVIEKLSDLLSSGKVAYIKWDNNRGMHELPSPSAAHRYMLGLYRVLDVLTTKFPCVLWEGCASGGGRIDPGILHYWPQSWISDNTDGLDRLAIQFGASMVYPASSMGGHVSAVPNHQTDRTTPLTFRAHVAMMCGSFGFELDPLQLSEDEREAIPRLVKLADRIGPLVIRGDQYRLAGPETNWPAIEYISEDEKQAVVLAYQIQHSQHVVTPRLRLQGLSEAATYAVDYGEGEDRVTVDGRTLMRAGLSLGWSGDYQSRVIWVTMQTEE